MIYTVSLPPAPSVNHLYGYARQGIHTRVYRTARAVNWSNDALLLLRAGGCRTVPPGSYWIAVSLTVRTRRLDVDAPVKLTLDVLADALGIDDRMVGALHVCKVPVATRAGEGLDLVVDVEPVDGPAAWAARSVAALPAAFPR